MAKIYGGKSKYLVKKDLKFNIFGNLFIPILIISFCYIMIRAMLGFITLNGASYTTVVLLFILILVIKIFENTTGKDMLRIRKFCNIKSDKYHRGWKGEEVIFKILETLSGDYTVFCDVNLYNHGNIDFIVLGPCGLLAIEVKSYKGRITFENNELLRNGYTIKEKNILKQTINEALDLRQYLKEKIQKEFFVNPVLVFSDKYASVKFGLNPINSVYVVQKEYLIKLIESFPVAVSREDAGKIEEEMALLYDR